MDSTWIHPLKNPPRAKDVSELSSPATQVLQALEWKFVPQSAIRGRSTRFPVARDGNLLRSNEGRSIDRSKDMPWHCRTSSPVCRNSERTVHSNYGFKRGFSDDLAPCVDSLHLSGCFKKASQLTSPVFPSGANAFCSPQQIQCDEEQSSELSGIFMARTEVSMENSALKMLTNAYSSPPAHQEIDSDRSSPMSLIDESVDNIFSCSPKEGIKNSKPSLSNKANSVVDEWDCQENVEDRCEGLNRTWETNITIVSNNADGHRGDGDISLYDSPLIPKMVKASPLTDNVLKRKRSFSPGCRSASSFCEQDQLSPIPFEKNVLIDKCIEINSELNRTSSHGEAVFLDSSANLNQNDSGFSPVPQLGQNLSLTKRNQPEVNSTVGDTFLCLTEANQLNHDSKHIEFAESPNNFRFNSFRKTPRKFLGTPLKRPLSSSHSTSKTVLEGTSPKIATHSSNKGSFTEEVSKINKGSDVFIKESNKENVSISNVCLTPTRDGISPIPLVQRSESRNQKVENARPRLLFPIFKPNNVSKHTSAKCQAETEVSRKKRLKFAVPYKRKEENSSGIRQVQELTEKLALEMDQKMSSTPPQETSFTLIYKEGFCQLNRPNICGNHKPKSILLRFMWPERIEYLSVTLQSKASAWSSSFLFKLLSDKTRKICFEAQEMIQLLVDSYNFSACEVSSKWLILDPLIGCWLLNPDKPPQSFQDIMTTLEVPQRGSKEITDLMDCLSTCAESLYENLTKVGLWKLFLHIEMRITPILASMEIHGIHVDVNKLKEMADILKHRMDAVQKAAYEVAGQQFQLTSPQQLGTILYDHLKLDSKHSIKVKETDKRHNKSTSESVLLKFKDLHPLPGIILEFRRLHKYKTTYVDAVLGHVSGSCIYTTWDQISAATGRITSNEPNLQAIPKQQLVPDVNLRSAFTARNGYSFLAADFQQIELRVFAHLSKDDSLIKALSNTEDVFKMLAQKWLQLEDIRKISEEDREKTKRIVYAVMYGAGPSKLSEFLHIDQNQANTIFNKFLGTFPKMQHFSRKVIEQCRKQGYLATESGRRRWFPQIESSNYQLRLHSERQAVNFLIQGTAADICKCAMVHTQRHLAAAVGTSRAVPTTRLLLQIHDELLWEVPDSDVINVANIVQEAMEGATSIMQSLSSFSVSLPIVMKVGKNWGEMNAVKSAALGSQQM